MLNFERLRTLHAVAAHGSVNAAATALHVTNSAVSQQIAKLESELGQSLLERNGRGVRLTDAATVLVAHTERMLSLMESAEAEFDAQRNSIFGQITVAAFPTAARGLAPHALRSLLSICPQLRVVLTEQEPPESIPLLVRGEVDLGFLQHRHQRSESVFLCRRSRQSQDRIPFLCPPSRIPAVPAATRGANPSGWEVGGNVRRDGGGPSQSPPPAWSRARRNQRASRRGPRFQTVRLEAARRGLRRPP